MIEKLTMFGIHWFRLIFACLFTWPLAVSAGSPGLLHHDLSVSLDPDTASIAVVDVLVFPEGTTDAVEFVLRSNLEVHAEGALLQELASGETDRLRRYKLYRLPADGKVQLNYRGVIQARHTHSLFGMPESVLSSEGVYLDGSSDWYPRFPAFTRFSFDLSVQPVKQWEVISQGGSQTANQGFRFSMPHPQDDIYLLAGPFHRYSRQQDDTEILVYLLDEDRPLAERYLEASAKYLDLYSNMIGAYPYAKFAVIENQWQTGYGMPSFTLLGSRVLRLPFILHSSLPHEILHNWWGNGVFVDFSDGNWSEGLTAYLSDHLVSEQRGEGAEYRRKALQRYADFAAQGREFALSEFRARHDDASQAIGYSKSLMLFHMLKQAQGWSEFRRNLRLFWNKYQFDYAGFRDVLQALYGMDRDALQAFQEQWLYRSGAPELRLGKTEITKGDAAYHLNLELLQVQEGLPYVLRVPADIHLEGGRKPIRRILTMQTHRQSYHFSVPARPVSIHLDPDFDVFRLLDPSERPATLGRIFGMPRQLLLLPGQADRQELQAWRNLALTWSRKYGNVEVMQDHEVMELPENAGVWVLGWQNRWLKNLRHRFFSAGRDPGNGSVLIDGQDYSADQHAVVMTAADAGNAALGFIGANSSASITALARKLPHYGSYGRLVFSLPGVNNILKQTPAVAASVMQRKLH